MKFSPETRLAARQALAAVDAAFMDAMSQFPDLASAGFSNFSTARYLITGDTMTCEAVDLDFVHPASGFRIEEVLTLEDVAEDDFPYCGVLRLAEKRLKEDGWL